MYTPPDDVLSRRTLRASVMPMPIPQCDAHDDLAHSYWNIVQYFSPPSQDHSMPDHWKLEFHDIPPFSIILRFAIKALCLISLGHPDLEHVWDICVAHEEIWTANKDRLSARITTITVVAGLLLSATASFATTTPPVGSILNYNTRGSYICLLLAFGLTLGGLIVGSTMLFVMSKCTASWFRETLMASRSRICCTLVLIAYPFICIGVATSVGAIGLLVAAWSSQDQIVRIGCTFVLLVLVSLIFVFAWTQCPPRKFQTSCGQYTSVGSSGRLPNAGRVV